MLYRSIYDSSLGKILILFDKDTLLGLYFEGQKEFHDLIKDEEVKNFNEREVFNEVEKFNNKSEIENNKILENKILEETKKWLNIYFSGLEPNFTPKINLRGTEFRRDVWKILLEITYGETLTYKDIANKLMASKKYERMSSQAVGGAVGANPISLIIPCHRVVGTSGSLTGYAGGLVRKLKLLELEGIDINNFFMPKNHE